MGHKISWASFLAMMLVVLAACGEAPVAAPTPAANVAEVGEVSAESDELTDEDLGDLVPEECFASDDAFWECDDEGLIPDECWDEDDYFIDACYGEVAYVEPEADADDSGFRPDVDGFQFENYGDETPAVNLTPVEMQRMFGDQVCANLTDGCTLTPPARQWMEQMNEGMSGGHCEGMAVLSALFYFDQLDPDPFGSAVTHELDFNDDMLQREIAYWWATQSTWPGSEKTVYETPSAVLDTLIEYFDEGVSADEWWSMGIYKPDFSGGHAITPYAVEDQGDGIYHVFVYDNNYPGESRIMTIDREAETWSYEASTNPNVDEDLYEGDATTQTLEIVAISPRLQEQEADFAEALHPTPPRGTTAKMTTRQDFVQIWLDGEADLLITTDDGRRIGWLDDGTFINEIDGAHSNTLKYGVEVWHLDEEPIYHVPTDVASFTITVDGTRLEEGNSAEVTIIGPRFSAVIEELWLDPGETDHITLQRLGPEYIALSYESEYTDSPDIILGLETDEADHEFIVRGTDIESGGAFNVELDYPNGDFILNTTGQEEYGVYEMLYLRYDDMGEHVFGHNEIYMEPNDTMYANFLDWEGDGSTLFLDFDYESDGSLDDVLELEDREDFSDDFYADWE